MGKRQDIKKILVIGAGPIVIGQACEFDYSGTQACKALKDEGYKVIFINSNPATIMTDPEVADKTYIEPITPEIVEKIIKISGKSLTIKHDLDKPSINTKLALISDKAFQDLGWKHQTSIEEGIGKTIKWFRENIHSALRTRTRPLFSR